MKRLEYDFVKEQFEKEGYKLLSKEYVNVRRKLEYMCLKGHRHKITYGDWYRGRRCRFCSEEIRASKRRLDFNTIKMSFENEGFILLTTKDIYKNVEQW